MITRHRRLSLLAAILLFTVALAGCWSRLPLDPRPSEVTAPSPSPTIVAFPPVVASPAAAPTASGTIASGNQRPTPGVTVSVTAVPTATPGVPAGATAVPTATPAMAAANAAGSALLSPQGTADQALAASRPLRDLADLAVRFKGVTPVQSTPTATVSPSYPVGRKDVFWVSDQRARTFFTVTATVAYVSPHAYFYVENGLDVATQALSEAADAFENTSYPTVRRYFGEERPGVDGDARITVLNARTLGPGIGGYFSSDDQYPRSISPNSNERNMVYIALGSDRPGTRAYNATLAHEFQHLVSWSVVREADTWFNEGSSELAMRLTGFGSGGSEQAYARDPDTQLTAWSEDERDVYAHYGAGYVFLDYFLQHYGGYEALPDLLAAGGRGTAPFDRYLAAKGYAARFDDIFRDWVIANYLDDRRLADGRYWYQNVDLQAATQRVDRYPYRSEGTIEQYGAQYFELSPGAGDVTIAITGTASSKLLGNVPRSGRYQWWSNRGDMMNTTLTRELDLRGPSKATLRFWAWFDIEEGYDYAYASISSDGGKTWHTLPGQYTTSDDPIGHNLGSGYTGKSGGGREATWVEENVDVSAYTGQRVLIRFEHVTDDAFNAPGFAVDDIAIPELGFRDDAEQGDGAWQAVGFVRTANVIPQRYSAQLISIGDSTKVETIPVDEQGRGRFATQGLGTQYRRLVLVLAPMAPVTTEPAPFELTVTATRG